MGSYLSSLSSLSKSRCIPDRFKSVAEVQAALRMQGVESCQMIIGIDFTRSNEWTGTKSCQFADLHYCGDGYENPYMKVIQIIGKTLKDFDEDGHIPFYGFGDVRSKDSGVICMKVDSQKDPVACDGFEDVLARYKIVAPKIIKSGPTSFAAIIMKAIQTVKNEGGYHILVIIADGQVDNKEQTVRAIVEASNYSLSIVMIGVGDGPWDDMVLFDDSISERKFDNFQFVNFTELMNRTEKSNMTDDHRDAVFAMSALMEIPDQYKYIKSHNLLLPGVIAHCDKPPAYS